jgi:hypothetical protein
MQASNIFLFIEHNAERKRRFDSLPTQAMHSLRGPALFRTYDEAGLRYARHVYET